jgi:hypothetical protein
VISERDLANLRIDTEEALDGICDIVHRALVDNDSGGQTVSETRETDVPCKVLLSSKPSERIIAAGVDNRQIATILFPVSITISKNDRIEIGDSLYEALGPDDRSTRVLQRIICIKTK